MIQYKLTVFTVLPILISVDSDNPNKSAEIQYQGNQDGIDEIKPILESSYGAFGHLIGTVTTPIDLSAAMNSPEIQQFKPELIEGDDLVKDYDPQIPEGSLT